MGAPYPSVPNVLKVMVSGENPGETWANVFYVQYSGAVPTSATLSGIASGIGSSWIAHITPWQISLTTFSEVKITDLSSSSGAEGLATFTQAGGNGDDPIPGNAAMLISYPVAARWRGGHFRQYLMVGGFAQVQDAMNWDASFVTTIQSAWTAFFGGFVGGTSSGTTVTQHVGVRWHGKYLPNGGPPAYVLTTPIVIPIATSDAIAHQQMASQKGRIGRRSK